MYIIRNKRGISPLIATVLIIGLVVVIGALVTLFLTKQVKSVLEKQPDCGPREILNTDMGISCVSSGSTCEVTFINNGQDKIDIARVVASSGESVVSPAATFINLEPGAEFPVTYRVPCDDNIRAYPGKVLKDDGRVRAALCIDKEVNARCQV